MTAKNRIAELEWYLDSLLNDREVQAALRRAAAAGRQTYKRARGQPASRAIKDKQLRRRAQAAAVAIWQVWEALDAAQTRRRPRWRRRLLLASVAAGGAYAAFLATKAPAT